MLLIVLCFEVCLYIRIIGTGVCFIGRSVLCLHISFCLGVSAKGRIWLDRRCFGHYCICFACSPVVCRAPLVLGYIVCVRSRFVAVVVVPVRV